MGFNRDVIRRRRDEMHELGVRVRWAGRRPRLWRSVISELEEAERLTRDNTVCTLTMCVNYGGRAEIADAARALALEVAAGRLDPDKRRRAGAGPLPRRARHARRRPVPAHVAASSAPATSCSGSRRTPRWCSSTSSGPTSTAAPCGGPASSTPRRDRRYGGAVPTEVTEAAPRHVIVAPGPAAVPRSTSSRPTQAEPRRRATWCSTAVNASARRDRAPAHSLDGRPPTSTVAPHERQTRWWWCSARGAAAVDATRRRRCAGRRPRRLGDACSAR